MNKKEFFFAYTIAHELKSPVITLDGFLKAIINDVLVLSQISCEGKKEEEFPLKRMW